MQLLSEGASGPLFSAPVILAGSSHADGGQQREDRHSTGRTLSRRIGSQGERRPTGDASISAASFERRRQPGDERKSVTRHAARAEIAADPPRAGSALPMRLSPYGRTQAAPDRHRLYASARSSAGRWMLLARVPGALPSASNKFHLLGDQNRAECLARSRDCGAPRQVRMGSPSHLGAHSDLRGYSRCPQRS
jgi:hypothetical protein